MNPSQVVSVYAEQQQIHGSEVSPIRVWVTCSDGQEYWLPLPPRIMVEDALGLLGIKNARNYVMDDDS